jgi:hypothetical protein
MTEYSITYITSEGDDYNIDGFENPHLTVGIHKSGTDPSVVFPLTISFANDFRKQNLIEADPELSLREIGAALSLIDNLSDQEEAEFYSDLFYNDETEKFDRALTFTL